MAALVEITLIGDTGLIASFDMVPALVMDRVEKAVVTSQLILEGAIKDGKLSGQVLNRITGNLRASIHSTPIERSESEITGSVLSDGSVKYAAIHEYGFDGDEEVREHMRTVCFGRKVAPFTVGAFTRHMKMPERSFIRSTFAEQTEAISQRLIDAGAEAVDEGIKN